ncbi:DUF2605 domain-containing protein [Geminocystis sp. NIES-3709]|uniref:DUF2605 domain-containing protein n=1 Tax=Geminocystis sp. NIES-3709 TaxID=1617448 RepID=UPI0005FC5328|nr:DUF2605 domain-containing protein [Geminocystis sp. NIES-3709]BAQ66116.1 hypothetical protein GM3709_2881 [Geminocystis sp. NIES-3709]
MHSSEPTEKELLKQVLAPLLEDFNYWFSRCVSLLESETMPFLSSDEQGNLLQKIKQAQDEVQTSILLFKVTEGQVGIDTKILMSWHQLVAQCWQIARKWRTTNEQLTMDNDQ